MQAFALRFESSTNGQDKLDAPPLSPLPVARPHMLSPRKVSNRHQVYVSPHKKPMTSPSRGGMTYVVSKSPAKVSWVLITLYRLSQKNYNRTFSINNFKNYESI